MTGWYEDLRRRAEEAFASGDADTALALFEQAERRARSEGDPETADLAYCNRATILVDLERGAECVPGLKRILLRSRTPRVRWMASYTTAMAAYMESHLEEALSWARRAERYAEDLDDPVHLAATANLEGNVAVLLSEFEGAEAAYRRALPAFEARPDAHGRTMAAQIRDNLGYVHLCTERIPAGIELCEEALREMERWGATHLLPQTLQDLCYGHLLDGGLEPARRHGERGLELALEMDDRLVVKNSLFLLAEVAVRQRDRFRARRYLAELARCYPEVAPDEEIIDVFLDMDLTRVVNLRG